MSPDDEDRGTRVLVAGNRHLIHMAIAKAFAENPWAGSTENTIVITSDSHPVPADEKKLAQYVNNDKEKHREARAFARDNYRVHGQKGFGRYK